MAVHGVLSTSSNEPVDRYSSFQIGSVTKAMTASMVAMLSADGALSLDDPVVAYVPEFAVADPSATSSITVRHLLSHTSGFDGDVWFDVGEGPEPIARLVGSLGDLPQQCPPGTGFSYSNMGYVVLGRLVERVTGVPFDAALESLVAVPSDASIRLGLSNVSGSHAVGHVRGDQGWVPVDQVEGPPCLAPAGSRTWATVDDLLAFGELHLGQRGTAHEALVGMRVPHVSAGDPNNGDLMGLGVFLDDRWGATLVFHDGGVSGQSAYFRLIPDLGAVLVVSATGGVPQVFHRHVLRALAASKLGLDAPLGAQADPTVRIDPTRVVGTYSGVSSTVQIRERVDRDGLEVEFEWRYGGESFRTGWIEATPASSRLLLVPYAGRDLVVVLPQSDSPCDHLLHGLRRVNRII